MDTRRLALPLLAAFVGLLVFHTWLLYRMVAAGNALLAGLLVVAIGLFAWRIAHYWRRFRPPAEAPPGRDAAAELRRIRTMVPVLAGLLALHAWLISVTVQAGELVLTALLFVAVVVFVVRLGMYTRAYLAIRQSPSR